MNEFYKNYLNQLTALIREIPLDKVESIRQLLKEANQTGKQIFVFGNGGSSASADHFITDLGKGASDKLPTRFRCLSLNNNTAWMTAIGNDYAYEDVFLRQLQNFARPGDIAMTMSVSGSSPNVVKAIEWANDNQLTTIALVGGKKGRLAEIARHVIAVNSLHYGLVEDIHMIILHMLCYVFMENGGKS